MSDPVGLGDLRKAQWHSPPTEIAWDDAGLRFRTGPKTDFWQHTWYGFRRDDGHFLGLDAPAEFSATVTFDAAYEHLYDQAGIMLRIDAVTWIKAGVEMSDGVTNVSTVVTRDGVSDWSVIAVPGMRGPQDLRLIRIGTAALLHHRQPDGIWQLIRLAAFPEGAAQVGPMGCTPEREGLWVTVTGFEIAPPLDNALHG